MATLVPYLATYMFDMHHIYLPMPLLRRSFHSREEAPTRAALQIHDRSPKSRPVAFLNQSQTQLTRPVLECNARQVVLGELQQRKEYTQLVCECRNFTSLHGLIMVDCELRGHKRW